MMKEILLMWRGQIRLEAMEEIDRIRGAFSRTNSQYGSQPTRRVLPGAFSQAASISSRSHYAQLSCLIHQYVPPERPRPKEKPKSSDPKATPKVRARFEILKPAIVATAETKPATEETAYY